MVASVSYVEKKFAEFNQLMFAGELPNIPIVLSDAKSFLGKFCYKIRKTDKGKTEYYDLKLRINTRLDLPEREVEDTIIHEMIHYFITYKSLEDSSSHGPLFLSIMNGINAKYGRSLTVSYKSSDEEKERLVDKKQHWHVVAVVTLKNGKTGIKVLPRVLPSILDYYNKILKHKDTTGIELFMSNDVFFNRFPNSSALKVHYLEKDEINQHLQDAETLECDGKRIVRHKR